MPDRERVISELGRISTNIVDGFITEPNKACHTIYEAVALLKEQEAVEPIRINTNYEQSWKCGKCGGLVNTHFKYCPYCGRPVKWE